MQSYRLLVVFYSGRWPKGAAWIEFLQVFSLSGEAGAKTDLTHIRRRRLQAISHDRRGIHGAGCRDSGGNVFLLLVGGVLEIVKKMLHLILVALADGADQIPHGDEPHDLVPVHDRQVADALGEHHVHG